MTNVLTPTNVIEANNSARLISEFVLQKPPSCVQFVPSCDYANYLVVGTYELEREQSDVLEADAPMDEDCMDLDHSTPQQQVRSGSIFLLEYTDSQLRLVDSFECPSAVYDLQFLEGDTAIFVTASSTGTISFYFVGETQGIPGPQIKLLWISQVLPTHTIITYLEIVSTELSVFGPLIAATTNTGGVYLMSYSLEERSVKLLNNDMPLTRHCIPRTNQMPDNAWCCASICDNGQNEVLKILSGSDGGILKSVIVPVSNFVPRINFENHLQTETHRFHFAGLTAILPLPLILEGSELILTGSYDERVRLYSLRLRRVLAEISLGGGVYRLRLVRQYLIGKSSYIVLATCMHAGTKVLEVDVKVSNGECNINVVATLGVLEEGDYSYAADFQPLDLPEDQDYKQLCVSGTWLDKKLRVWDYNCKAEDRSLAGEINGLVTSFQDTSM
ncbi:uncharacterized protein RAG0_07181 [Rhynchosporium agropyri]|uniref:Uncharacterized protein n=1 Tax=Rhynchosporium agropyri TaxID=914238 RepID=A0A1E1KK63_9HELO|nr:uncharacterized protein RAG0_07181 [Rhynchosporium agropyri]